MVIYESLRVTVYSKLLFPLEPMSGYTFLLLSWSPVSQNAASAQVCFIAIAG